MSTKVCPCPFELTAGPHHASLTTLQTHTESPITTDKYLDTTRESKVVQPCSLEELASFFPSILIPISIMQSNQSTPSGNDNSSTRPMSGSAPSRNLFNWIQSPFATANENETVAAPGVRVRRDSSTLTADEALNISRANKSKPINIASGSSSIPEQPVVGSSSPSSSGNHKFDKLGLITAFSGGPGSF